MNAEPGRVTRALLQWLMRPARIAAVETVSPHFRMIEFEGDSLKDVAWTAGQKIQVAMGSGLSARTYTPMSWDAERGRTRLLAFMHGDGPGSRWAGTLRPGDGCHFLGPRRSLDLTGLAAPLVLCGDETSFGLAAALGNGPTLLFEASDAAEARAALAAIHIEPAALIERTADDAHLAALEAGMSRPAASGAHFVLTGKASSIQRMMRCLKAAGVASPRIRTKAYWAPGKAGLD